MNLKVLLPTKVLVDEDAAKVTAEAANGSFSLLPRHIDFVAPLAPGLLSFETPSGREEFLAVDEGVLVKCGDEVLVSTRQAVRGADLGALQDTVDAQFSVLDEKEKAARAASARLEADLVRRFMELGG
ncbi:F0F1 ATP synthase subunit epsilon [bacterium]|nr:F0F1 ATP synthase subunit epsilon [bacterium]